MESMKNEKLVLSKAQKDARLAFSIKHHSLDWNTVVFMGLNKKNGVDMWGAISRFDGCAFRAVVGHVNTYQYVSFLDHVILEMWNSNKDLVFMHDKRQSHLSRLWRTIHPQVKFLYWPKILIDENPFNDVWSNFNNRLEDELYDLTELYASWEDTRDDFDNFHFLYEGVQYRLQKIIENSGNDFEE